MHPRQGWVAHPKSQMVTWSCTQESETPGSAAGPATRPKLPAKQHAGLMQPAERHRGKHHPVFPTQPRFPTQANTALEVLPGDKPVARPSPPAAPWGLQQGAPERETGDAAARASADWAQRELCNPLGYISTAIWSSTF